MPNKPVRTYQVTITHGGYGDGQVYNFKAEAVLWTSTNSLRVTFGAATWPIINVASLSDLTSGRAVPVPYVKAPIEKVGKAKAPVVKPLVRAAIRAVAATQPVLTLSQAERKALHSLLFCHLGTGLLRSTGLEGLSRRLSLEFGTDDVPALGQRDANGYAVVIV